MLHDCATDTLARELAMAISQSPAENDPPTPERCLPTSLWHVPELSINGSAHAPRLRPGAYLLEQALRELAA